MINMPKTVLLIPGWAFGKGIYTADQFNKSMNYCWNYGGESNTKFMLVCQVSTVNIVKLFNNEKQIRIYTFCKLLIVLDYSQVLKNILFRAVWSHNVEITIWCCNFTMFDNIDTFTVIPPTINTHWNTWNAKFVVDRINSTFVPPLV